MPITNSKDIINFVNGLEQSIIKLQKDIVSWNENSEDLINSRGELTNTSTIARQTMVRADNALAEINTAVIASTATAGRRLDDTLKKLKQDIYLAIENGDIVGVGGGGEVTSGEVYEEINNAIAEVDPTIQSGLRLDYRLKELYNLANAGSLALEKKIYTPRKFVPGEVTDLTVQGEVSVTEKFVAGEVTVLDETLLPIIGGAGDFITATIDETGLITFSEIPTKRMILFYPIEIEFKDVEKDFLYIMMEMLLKKNNPLMQQVLGISTHLNNILADIEAMKGAEWTVDFSIMSNHLDIIKESITPKGVYLSVEDGKTNVSFSYTDSPLISHFVAEKFDEGTGEWVPANANGGIINT